ncbi:hypothetical protein L2E82_03588 [Cichorium intybus]|uniref:Uncharacterized protein n=1 Tax=Cichorium intybus TaxID=13427 RepID=A0ACB9H437_CICIN|nr:hypothetical protein L2E82_03588 [Cichorium intybus]
MCCQQESFITQTETMTTVKLAARIANKKQCFPEQKQSNESFKVWEDMEDQHVPMSLETTEPQKDLMA